MNFEIDHVNDYVRLFSVLDAKSRQNTEAGPEEISRLGANIMIL